MVSMIAPDCTVISKSAADGTAYVPNKGCGGSLPYHNGSQQAVIVSENNGLTWTVRPVTTSTGDGNNTKSDPSVAVATDGTLYFAYQANDGHQHVSVSKDKGQTWSRDTDIGLTLGIQNSVFPVAVAGDPDRAAVAFFGTTTSGANYHCGQGDDCSRRHRRQSATTVYRRLVSLHRDDVRRRCDLDHSQCDAG